jgi:ankyrin repeat protein
LFYLQTPLHLAVLNGNAEITQMLISFGAQPSVKDSNGDTALHLAVLHGNLDCVKAILNTNNTKSLPLDDFNDEGKCIFDLYFESLYTFCDCISGRCLVCLQKTKTQGSAKIWIK